ncbi:hypothetical protein HNQ60_001199 [Povalibacter uvarum]|uniref:Uncharacterized protein n=1 Tax=Povalibacter uvarum TaxID=732238 RepID=A0A841HI28_9GAMM|nr:hypothetical protein [Povalibacter uvarum]MBB6092353.1 hypothetical protein [Povalibacter uvarum]
MKKIYELKTDAATIAALQRASLSSGVTGLKTTHGLIGSEEWWSQIRNGVLRLQTREGVVSGFWPGQHGEGPAEFQLREPDGTESIWMCELEPSAARSEFRIGRDVRVEFVLQQLKTAFGGANDTKVVVSLATGEAQQSVQPDRREDAAPG